MVSMSTDEAQIRELVQAWLVATKAGDIDTLLGLMTDDVAFLLLGRAPMNRAEFIEASQVPPGVPRPRFEGTAEILELQISGDLAYAVTRLSVAITPPGGQPPIERAGETLSVFRRESGQWRLARDANLMTKVERV
jgi:uncharacterized protein (TIGR02246 family)